MNNCRSIHCFVIALFCDSQSAIFLTKYQMFHEMTKHIGMWYHFMREIIVPCNIVVSKVGIL